MGLSFFMKFSTENNVNFIAIICMAFFCTTGIVLLCIMLIKDDSGIRFAKLNALMTLKQELDLTENSEITEEECEKCPLKKDSNDSTVPDCCKKTTKKKNLYAEISKNLMNSITEI